jgi:hypothetical protein
MESSVQTQIIREDPAIEAYRLGLLKDVQSFIKKQISQGTLPPDYQVAGLSGLEQAGARVAEEGIGGYEQYIAGGLGGVQAGQAAVSGAAMPMMGTGFDAFQQGLAGIPTTAEQFDPTMAQAYMDPYEDQVVQQSLRDLQRQSDIAQVGDQARAVGAGAFGGSREGIVRAENTRNLQEAQIRSSGQLRSAGYQQSLLNAQQAFEAAQQRQLEGVGLTGQLAQGIGQLGLQTGQLGGQLGTLGLQEAGLGELSTNLGIAQSRNLMDIGGIQRAQQQSELDALRQTNLARQAQPYQQYAFLSDIYKGTPSGQQVITSQAAAQPSSFQTLVGTGIGATATAAGARSAGLF